MRKINTIFEKVYTEAKMLNEMNPKLRRVLGSAALAAALGMGTIGCSTPNDGYDEPPAIEQPAPETPETPSDPTFENPDDQDSYDDPAPETPEVEEPEEPADSDETETEDTVTFETLGVADYADSLASARKQVNTSSGEVKVYNKIPITDGYTVYIYRNGNFELASIEDEDAYDDISERGDVIYIRYNESDNRYYVPESMEFDFDTAIAAYKAAYAE